MNNMRNIRNTRNISQQEVADYLGITRQAYSNYETSAREPDYETLLKIAEYFSVSLDYLLRGDMYLNTEATEDQVKVALFGGDSEVTDEMWEEVVNYSQYIKEREAKKKGK